MSAIITVEFVVPVGYVEGDYAKLHSNGGDGSIDWGTAVSDQVYELFPHGAGIYGFGHAPFGHYRFGHAHSMHTPGFGHLPFGHYPFGHGTAIIQAACEVDDCGEYEFGLTCYDGLGNPHSGSPDEVEVEVHIAPPAPTGLKKNSYNKTTDVLILDVAA